MIKVEVRSFYGCSRIASLVGLAGLFVALASCTTVPAAVQKRTLTVMTANIANAFALGGGITWEVKMDRLAEQLSSSGQVPDIISMTESSGWTNCTTPAQDNSGDYDMVDRLIWRLRDRLGVTFRVAYLVGAQGSFGGGRCQYYSGDTVLYNPNRIINLTPGNVAARPQAAHNENLRGFQVRRSLPICNRGARTNIPDLEQLIDGPSQFDKCNRATPAAPAWAWQVQNPDGGYGVVATMARFGLIDIQGATFDVVTTHPTSTGERWQYPEIDGFISALTQPPYRNTRPYYPVIVLGDFNCLSGLPPYLNCPGAAPAPSAAPWPAGTTQVFFSPDDVMGVALGAGGGPLPPQHTLAVQFATTLPSVQPCRPYDAPQVAGLSFSDHCALLVRFTE